MSGKKRALLACALWILSVVPFALASAAPNLFSGWYPAWSAAVSGLIARATGVVPFSVFEAGAAALLVAAVVYIVRAARRGRRGLLRAFATVAVWSGAIAVSFVWLWGINYFMPTPSARMGLVRADSSAATLKAAAKVLRDDLNELARHVPREDDLRMSQPTFWEARSSVAEGYDALAAEYGFLSRHNVPVKWITLWFIQSYTGISGIYTPWTAEGNVNPDTPWPGMAATMAHEMAHRQGAAPEDEANFLGLMACRASSDVRVKYSGAFTAFVYMSNALAQEDPVSLIELWQGLDISVLADLNFVTQHYEQYEGPVNDAGEAVNDAYLRAMRQEEGVKSYGLVVDLLIADLLANGRIRINLAYS